MSMVDNSLRVHDMGVLQQPETVQRKRVESSNDFGGITLEKSTPQPRNDRSEPAPELKELRELAPYIANGTLVRPKPEVETYETGGPLEQLLTSMDSVRNTNPALYTRCDQALDNIEESFLLLKSPPEYDTKAYAQQLKDQAQLLRDMSVGMFGKGEGSDVMIGGKDGVPLGPRIKEMLEQTAKELEDYSNYVGGMPDPRPTMQSVGHFKSFETLGAMKTLDHYIGATRQQITDIVARYEVDVDGFMTMSDAEIDHMCTLVNARHLSEPLQNLKASLETLLLTKEDLEVRHQRFTGQVGGQFSNTDPLDKQGLTEAMGKKEKPGFFAKLFNTIGAQIFGRAMKDMDRNLGEGRMPPITSPYMSESKMMTKLLGERLKLAGFEGISSKDLEHKIEHNHVKALSEDQQWDVIDKDVHLVIDGQNRTFKSVLTPHNQLGTTETPGEGKGVCCHDGESEIPVNMWQSELQDETGKTMFRQLRTGVNCAYEIKDTDERKSANLNRARDMLETHVKTHPGVQEKLKEGQGTQDNPVVLRNVWVSHLTPDPIRPVLQGLHIKGQNENELLMSREQNEAMQMLAGMRQFNVMVEGQERNVWVKYEPIMFSTGVNPGAVNWYSGVAGNWGLAKEEFNEPSMETLLGRDGMNGGEFGGWVKDGIDTNNRRIQELRDGIEENGINLHDSVQVRVRKEQLLQEFEQKISDLESSNERIETLAQQVQEIWSSESYQKSGEDPYKLSSRLGVLGYEIGCAITSNCKSNKDRNSYGDVHMKDLTIQMHTKGEVRGPNEPRSREEELNLRTLTRESGNHELQKLNVGGAGYKLSGVERAFQAQGLPVGDPGFYGLGKYTAT